VAEPRVVLITGARKGIGRALAEHYLARGDTVVGLSREPSDLAAPAYRHLCATVERVLGTNVAGTFLLCREGAKLMQRWRFGRIVNFGSVAMPLKLEGEAIYAASKAAVVTLTHVLARELADYGITVNAIAPTPVKTDLIRNVPPEKIEQLIARQAIRRFGEFRDIANVVDFFVSPESDFVTGQVIYLGGAA
jgi:3-oxoacyl-[acyl-carrier protein] reductase